MNQLNDWMQLLVGALTAATLIGGGAAWVGKRLKRWFERRIKEMADDSREAAKQLKTRNGTTVAQYVEAMSDKVSDHGARLEKLESRMGAAEGRLMAVENAKQPVIVNVPPGAPTPTP